jgi:hypothetical protein
MTNRVVRIAVLLGGIAAAGGAMLWSYERDRHERAELRAELRTAVARAVRAEQASRAAAQSTWSAARVNVPRVADARAARSQGAEPLAARRAEGQPRAESLQEELAEAEVTFSKYQDALHAEPRDAAWSNDVEASLTELYSDKSLANSRLTRVECAKTLCSMQARHIDVASYQHWLERLPVHEQGFSKRVTLRRLEADGAVVTTTVMAREGHDLPNFPR